MAKTRVLLVYPEIPETYWSMKRAIRIIGKKALMPPLGLLTVAAFMPEEDFELRLVDMNIERLLDADLIQADLVMLSAMLVQKASFHEVLARCLRLGVPVAAGGPYPTACRGEMEGVDFLFFGEGERTLPAFVEDWRHGLRTPRIYEERERPSLDEAPVPRFDLAKVRDYSMMPVQFSRGCPFACEFCDITSLFGRAARTKSPERFLKELDAIRAAGKADNVFVVDDNFIGDRRRTRTLLDALIPWQREKAFPFTMSTETSVDLAADEGLMDLMVAANFRMVFVGLETPHAASLASTGKRQNLRRDPVEAVKVMQGKGLQVTGGFIVGFDTDPPDICSLQADFVKRLAVPVAMVGVLTALPGTELCRRLEREGRLLARSSGNNTHDVTFNFRTLLPVQELLAGYHRLIEEIYRPRVYFDRCVAYLRRLPRGKIEKVGTHSALRPVNLLYLLRSFALQAFSSYGFEYLRYLARGLLANPRQIYEVVTLAVQGRHFFSITQKTLARFRARMPEPQANMAALPAG
jgi:radical SAM superfamily enzyme YgiQ (UPF0313 family)